VCEFSIRPHNKVTSLVCFLSFSVSASMLVNTNVSSFVIFFLAHVLFSALVGVFGGFLGCRLYRLGVFTIGECLGLVSSTQSFSVPSCFFFPSVSKRFLVHNLSYGNEFDLQDNERARESHFYLKGCAPTLVLKQR